MGRWATMRSAPVPLGTVPVRIGTELTWLPNQARRDGVQLLHSLGNTAPARTTVPSVLTIHDLHYHRFPKIQDRQTRVGLQILVRTAARRSKRIICPSEATKEDAVEILGIDPERVHVVPHGPGRPEIAPLAEDELRARYALGDAPLIFCPAVGFVYKNIGRLLEAFALVAADTDAILVQSGWPAREGDALRRRASELGITDRVRFVGWVDEATVEGLYAAARMLVTPSIAEGFGLPVLEAMRRDPPVACSGTPGSRRGRRGPNWPRSSTPTTSALIAASIERLLEEKIANGAQELCRARSPSGRALRAGTASRPGEPSTSTSWRSTTKARPGCSSSRPPLPGRTRRRRARDESDGTARPVATRTPAAMARTMIRSVGLECSSSSSTHLQANERGDAERVADTSQREEVEEVDLHGRVQHHHEREWPEPLRGRCIRRSPKARLMIVSLKIQ